MWNINSYIQSLQLYEELTPRKIYWRLWGIVNVLYCDICYTTFQCCNLNCCLYHPPNVLLSDNTKQIVSCCGPTFTRFTVLPKKQVLYNSKSELAGCIPRKLTVITKKYFNIIYSYSMDAVAGSILCPLPV